MSTNNDKRPSIDSTKFSLSKLFTEIRNNIRSLRQGLLLASISSLILGFIVWIFFRDLSTICLLYTSPSPRDQRGSRMPSSA